MRRLPFRAFAALLTCASAAAAQDRDSLPERRPFVTAGDAAWVVGFGAASAALSVFDRRLAANFRDTSLAHVQMGRDWAHVFTRVNETTLTAGGILTYGIARLAGSRTVADIALHTTGSVVVASLASQAIRGPLGRSRPHVTDYEDPYDFHFFRGFGQFRYRAFPSIHTSSAFAAATALVMETRYRRPDAVWFVAPVAYTVALTPALARMYMGQHWATDIFMGAFMGTISGVRVVTYMHENPDNAIDKRLLPVAAPGARESLLLGVGWTF